MAASTQPVYPGSCEVVSRHDTATSFPTFEQLKALVAGSTRDDLGGALSQLRAGHGGELILTPSELAELGYERLLGLERDGIVATKYDARHPLGSYALDDAPRLLPNLDGSVESREIDREAIYTLRRLRGGISLITRPASAMTPDQLKAAPFENRFTSAKVIAVCTMNDEGQWEWTESGVYPDGNTVTPSLTSSGEYAQDGFEGQLAKVDENGNVIIFRPEENAKRLQPSCKAIAMPPLSLEQYIDSLKHAVMANAEFLTPGSTLYIRPSIRGLGGGRSIGIGTPDAFLLTIDVFPFGTYAGGKDTLLDIAFMDKERRALPGEGSNKLGKSYARTIDRRERAKAGRLDGYEGQKFQDILYAGQSENGDVIDEFSSGNLFCIKMGSGKEKNCRHHSTARSGNYFTRHHTCQPSKTTTPSWL